MATRIETDYLVVGSGAGGMAFTDEVIAHSDAQVVIVDRRHAPGGHWIDAYPFVRLHQPSAFYGVTSMSLGQDRIDDYGLNAGFYELADANAICGYYARVMQEHFVPSGQVRHFPCCEHVGNDRFVSRLSGEEYEVTVRRKVVDTTITQGKIPATSPPPFEVADGVRCIPVGEVVRVTEPPDQYVVVGAGKTAMDACVWLLRGGVDPVSIRWIKPREAWWLNRKYNQPATMLGTMYLGLSLQVEAAAKASSEQDFFDRMEAQDLINRVDQTAVPTMFRGAITSDAELQLVRQIEDVIRLGHVRRIEPTRILLQEGEVATTPSTLHLHCASSGLNYVDPMPVYTDHRIAIQHTRFGFAPYSAAVTGFVEVAVQDDLQTKNELVPAIRFPNTSSDFLRVLAESTAADYTRSRHPMVSAWQRRSRLNPMSGLADHLQEPHVKEAHARFKTYASDAIENLRRLTGD